MRLFIGVPFPEPIPSQIHQAVSGIRDCLSKGRLSSPEGYHLTLKFLGEVPPLKGEELSIRFRDHAFGTKPFPLEFTTLGAFSKRGGDILWLGVNPVPQLLDLQQEIADLAEEAGFQGDVRPYSPHLTLARGVRYVVGLEDLASHWRLPRLGGTMDRVVLYHSTQKNGHLAYVPLVTRWLG